MADVGTQRRATPVVRSLSAVSATLGVVLVLLGVAGLAAAPAQAAGAGQSALCDGYGGAGGCRIGTDDDPVDLGSSITAATWGNPGVDVEVMAYLVEFNSSGAITELVPASTPEAGRTKLFGSGQGLATIDPVVPFQPAGHPSGGWLWLGLTDDSSLDLSSRIGTLIQFGGDTVRLLGDGYAAQKPVGETLHLDVIGYVSGASYWVEYLDDRGRWVPVPGQGYDHAQRLTGEPGKEPQQLTYTVPGALTQGARYQFRVNSGLNYSRPGQLVAQPAFVEWTVIPSSAPVEQDRGHNLDPGLAPGDPDSPSGSPTGSPSGSPTGSPSGSPTGSPTHGHTSPNGNQPTSHPGSSAESTATKPPTSTPSRSEETQNPTATPTTAGSAGLDATTSPDPGRSATDQPSASATGAVWGNEAPLIRAGPVLPASAGTSRGLALLGVILLAAPVAWWLVSRRRTRAATAEELL